MPRERAKESAGRTHRRGGGSESGSREVAGEDHPTAGEQAPDRVDELRLGSLSLLVQQADQAEQGAVIGKSLYLVSPCFVRHRLASPYLEKRKPGARGAMILQDPAGRGV
jgi:hypothetical protein